LFKKKRSLGFALRDALNQEEFGARLLNLFKVRGRIQGFKTQEKVALPEILRQMEVRRAAKNLRKWRGDN